MADESKQSSETPPPQAVEKNIPLDTRLLSDAVIELNISRKNVSIYPPGHAQITKSIDRAFDVLLRLFAVRDEMTLGVAKDTLFVGQDYLDRKNPVFRDFALSLNAQGIAAVTFVRGLDLEELELFHRIITTKPEDVIAAGGIAQVIASVKIPHIRVTAIDYASFHLTEEEEIFKGQERPSAAPKEAGGGGMWMDFVSLISAGTLATGGDGVSINDASAIDPAELAKLLNERKLNPGEVVQSYDHIISSHVRRSAEKRLTREQSETLTNLNSMLRELNPDLRKQFLSSAFKNLSDGASNAAAEEVLGGMGDDMIIDMLRQASAEGREISPTLTGLLGKLASVRDKGAPASARQHRQPPSAPAEPEPAAPAMPPGGGAGPEIQPDQMNRLFDREKYEHYVGKEYDDLLKGVSGRAESMAAAGTGTFPLDEYLKTFEDEHLDFQIGRALIAFMEEKIDAEDYQEFAKKLAVTVPDLLASGNFPLLLDILQALRWHLTDKQDELVRTCAAGVLQVYWSPDFVAKAVAAFDRWSRTKGREASAFLHALGPATIPGLLDLYAQDDAPGGRRVVFDLLAGFGQPAVIEALKRLQEPRPETLRNLLMLIRRAAVSADVLPAVRPLLQHKDARVRLEALAVLLRFKDPAAVDLLRKEIQSSDPDVSMQAVFLAGQFRVTAVVEHVLALLKSVVFFESDYKVNEEIIRVLGDIGDPRVLPELEKLAKGGLTLYRTSQDRMRRTIFETLDRYPKQSIASFLKAGERSNDEKIRSICRKLAR